MKNIPKKMHATKFYNLKNRYEESTWSIIT